MTENTSNAVRPMPWENPNPNAPRVLPAPHGRHHVPASEAHKRGLADDYRKAIIEEKPALLRRIVGAEWNHAYKGRTNILDETADEAFKIATDEKRADDLNYILLLVQQDLDARKEAAALLNKENPPGVVAGIIAKRVRLGKTSPVVLGRENVMPRERSVESLRARIPERPAEDAPLTKAALTDKQDFPVDDTLGSNATPSPDGDSEKPVHPLDEFVPPKQPTCLNDWAHDDKKRYAFWDTVRDMPGIPTDFRTWALKMFGVPDEFMIDKSVPEALAFLRERAEPKPEPKSAKPEQKAEAIDMQTGKITLPSAQPSAMVTYQPSAVSLLPEQAHWNTMREQADILIKSGFLPPTIRTPEQAVAIMMMGEALNVKPIIALQSINVIQGKPTVSPQLMLALIRKSGALQDLTVTDDGSACTVVMTRKGETAHTEIFSMVDAGSMNLSGKDNWKKQPAVMRKWRAISAACRVVFPDIILGFYMPEELNPDAAYDAA